MKQIIFLGTTLQDIHGFSEQAKNTTGQQLRKIQYGQNPDDWKPISSIGTGIKEIRVKFADGIYRIIYVAKFEEVIYVLHPFHKKTRKTHKQDIELAKKRLKMLEGQRK